jgi:glycosyltransferase involved in cell wall biosynthesis
MTLTILFCGPIPLHGATPIGGYEACNRRTIEALRERGVSLRELHYPQPRGGKLAKLGGYLVGFLALHRAVGAEAGSDKILHLTGLYKHFAAAELLLLRQAHRHGMHTVYDIRAGSMFKHYERLGPLYRWLFRRLLSAADQVMIEGMDYAPFVFAHTGRAAIYLPNHVLAAGIPARPAAPLPAHPRLLYVGRVTLEKGVETALQTTRLLRAHGLPCTLAIAGPVAPALLASLQLDYTDVNAEWLGSLSSDAVLAQLGRAHLFIFPTRHPGEGHSNALTEAMAMGCVAVASDNGFNRSVIGDTGLILPRTATAGDYAEAIATLWQQQRWEALSEAAMARTKALFSTESAVARLHAAYLQLMKDAA